MNKKDLISLFFLKIKFALSSVAATLTDYFLYLYLIFFIDPVPANLISASLGMIINFIIQKRYIFELKRNARLVFLLSALISLGGVGLSTLFIYLLNKISFFNEYQFITKALVVAIIFNYNFYFKRFAFEKRFLPDSKN